jgi:hypothetical protein
MLILPLAVLIGLLGGWAMNGSWRSLLDARLRHPSFVLAAIAVQASLQLPGVRDWPSGLRFAIVLTTYLVLGGWLVENVRCSLGSTRFAFAVVGLNRTVREPPSYPSCGKVLDGDARRADDRGHEDVQVIPHHPLAANYAR